MPWCGICNGDLARQQTAERDRGLVERRTDLPPGVVQAEFPTRCRSCREYIEVGDLIKFSEKEQGWIGVECCG